jgi:hypothetical protein
MFDTRANRPVQQPGIVPHRLQRVAGFGARHPNRSPPGHTGSERPAWMGESVTQVVEMPMASWCVGLTVEVPLQARH